MLIRKRLKVSCRDQSQTYEIAALCGWSGIAARKFLNEHHPGFLMTGMRYEAPRTDSTEAYHPESQYGLKVWVTEIDESC